MPIITVRNINSVGRFGNALFLYAFARGYAEVMGCQLLMPADWLGRRLFVNATEPAITPATANLPQTELDAYSKRPMLYFAGHRDIDIQSYCQHQVYLEYYTREKVRDWLKLKPEWERFAPPPSRYSAAHIRRGDYVDNESYKHSYCAVSEQSYDRAITQFAIPEPVYRVFDGWRKPSPDLPAGLAWLEDWLILRDASHLLRANSTFSWWAACLGHGQVYSPVVEDKVGWNEVEFVEGNHPTTAGKFHNQSDLHLKE